MKMILQNLRLLVGLCLLLAGNQGHTQSMTVKAIFPRGMTYEHRIIKILQINPENLLVAYDEAPKNFAGLTNLQKAFGRLSLLAAEVLSTEMNPQYSDPDKLLGDLERIYEFRVRVQAILGLLVMNELGKSVTDEPGQALKSWGGDLFKYMKIRVAASLLNEYNRWYRNPCGYVAEGYKPSPNCGSSLADMVSKESPPQDILAKAGLKSVLNSTQGGSADNFARTFSLGMSCITVMAASGATLGSVLTTLPGGMSGVSLFAAFGGSVHGMASAGASGAIGAMGWGAVVAAPIAATLMAVIVGTTEGFKVVEAQKTEPMLKMKLGAAITDPVNITNVLTDADNRNLFMMAFTEASLRKYQLVKPSVDGEVRFYCQAGYVSRFRLSYTVNESRTGPRNVEQTTRDLNVGSEESFIIPANATNIRVQGWALTDRWLQVFNRSVFTPTFLCFTTYGTIFKPEFKTDCPEVASMTTVERELTVTHGGGYEAWVTLTYKKQNGQTEVAQDQRDLGIGWRKVYKIPYGATNIRLLVRVNTGLVWDPWKTAFDKTWPEPPNECIKVYGTSLDPRWNNECR